jgi:cell wall-associated protease
MNIARHLRGLTLTLLIVIQSPFLFGQVGDSIDGPPDDWYLRDPETDSVQGVSSEKTYQTLLKDKPSKPVLVAVIDSGVDIDHEDLKDVIWTNEDEIPGNGVDDDKNGFVDDIHGWNFIGGKEGNVAEDTYEVTREYARLKTKYENIDSTKVNKKNKAEYAYWKKVKAKYDNDSEESRSQLETYQKQYEMYVKVGQTIQYCDSVLERAAGKPVLKSTLASIEATNDTVSFAKNTLMQITETMEGDFPIKDLLAEVYNLIGHLQGGVEHFRVAVEYGYNTEFDSRKVVGDDPNNLTQISYGNSDVEGPDPKHGTHVSGIIAANRKNNIGVKGIADNVKIMPVRAVPNGDERDKDVANAIRYAADNGAQIINMSFGKSFSPNKDIVDKAVKYAESKGVLMIHAAGNDSNNLDEEANFPNRTFEKGGQAKTWLEIGASAYGRDQELVGTFSNYGKKSVDLFAPGVQIYSTIPDNEYANLQGTSMACPATSGVAAILMSYFPHLTAADVKEILRQSTRKFSDLKVIKPGTKEEIAFSDLSMTGGLVNAYEAVKLAMTWKPAPGKAAR